MLTFIKFAPTPCITVISCFYRFLWFIQYTYILEMWVLSLNLSTNQQMNDLPIFHLTCLFSGFRGRMATQGDLNGLTAAWVHHIIRHSYAHWRIDCIVTIWGF